MSTFMKLTVTNVHIRAPVVFFLFEIKSAAERKMENNILCVDETQCKPRRVNMAVNTIVRHKRKRMKEVLMKSTGRA